MGQAPNSAHPCSDSGPVSLQRFYWPGLAKRGRLKYCISLEGGSEHDMTIAPGGDRGEQEMSGHVGKMPYLTQMPAVAIEC